MTDFRVPQALTIPNGAAVSNVLDATEQFMRSITSYLLVSPGTLPETVNIEVSPDGIAYGVLQSGGTDIVLAAGKATQLTEIVAAKLRLKSGVNVAADRVFTIVGSVRK